MQRKVVIYEESRGINRRAGVVTIKSGDGGLISWITAAVANEIKRANLRVSPISKFSFKLSKLNPVRKRRAK